MLKQLAFVCVLPLISSSSSFAQNINDLLSEARIQVANAQWPDSMLHWQTQVVEILSRGKRYPADALSRGEQGTVLVGLILGRTGNLISSHIAKSSGSDSLDREALDLVSRVKGFPLLPSDYTEDKISVTIPIKFNLDKPPNQQPSARVTMTPPSSEPSFPAVSHSNNIDLSQPSQAPSDRPASACDTYAASEFDTQRKAAGVSLEKMDPNLAVPACESALRQYPDDARLKFQLGRAYYKANNFTAALAQFRKAAEQDFAAAQQAFGFMYENGRGVPQDYQQAIAWYRKAAERDFAAAQANLGALYMNGWGATQDYQQAIAWYRKAAEQNLAYGQNALGFMYENGRGVPQDYQQAVAWYRKAADQNLAAAQFNLGQMYERGSGITQDYQQAIAWYQKAADQGQKEAKAKLAEVKAKLGALPTVTSSPTLEQTAAYIILSGDVDLSQMTTNSDGSVNTPFHNIFGSPFTVLPAAVTKVIDRPNCIVEVVMQAVQGMQPEKQMYFYFNRVSGFRDEEVYAARLGNFTRIWALSELPVFCASGGGTRLTGELIPENYSCITDAPLVGGIKPQNVERVHKALDYLYSQFCVYATKRSPF